MTIETVISAGYHRPAVQVKLEILLGQHGYTEGRAASLYGKTMTLAVIRCGELQVAEGKLARPATGLTHASFPRATAPQKIPGTYGESSDTPSAMGTQRWWL